jgi:hypothetical protein
VNTLMLTFESTHEYYLGNDPSILYCEDHGTLIVTQDHEDRLLISGINKDTMLKFATKLYRDDLNKTLESIKTKEVDKEVSEV